MSIAPQPVHADNPGVIEVPESEAAERFSELLDDVLHGQIFQIMRDGEPIAKIEPLNRRDEGAESLRDVFRRHATDPTLTNELQELRSLATHDPQPINDLTG
jgi:antitoxin (DNA-binding transcriptional repressor) of toxin-antitoxin stability system